MTEIKRCKVCGVTLCRDNANIRKHGRVTKLGNLCVQCERDRQLEKKIKYKKAYNTQQKMRRDAAVHHPHKCSFCGGAMGISTVIENKLYKKRLNCCVKCNNRKNSSHDIYTSIVRGNSYPEFIVGFNSQKEKDDFLFWRNLQINYSGVAYGSRVSKVGQTADHIVVSEDENGTVSYATEIQRCVEKKVAEDGSTTICGGLLRYDHREVLHCTICELCY